MIAPESVEKVGGVGKEDCWFNDVAGFQRLPAYTRRTHPYQYDNLTGPSFWNVDAMLGNAFSLPRSAKLEFRLEAYNAFNNINWANPTRPSQPRTSAGPTLW